MLLADFYRKTPIKKWVISLFEISIFTNVKTGKFPKEFIGLTKFSTSVNKCERLEILLFLVYARQAYKKKKVDWHWILLRHSKDYWKCYFWTV